MDLQRPGCEVISHQPPSNVPNCFSSFADPLIDHPAGISSTDAASPRHHGTVDGTSIFLTTFPFQGHVEGKSRVQLWRVCGFSTLLLPTELPQPPTDGTCNHQLVKDQHPTEKKLHFARR